MVDAAAKLLDFTQPLDVNLLDLTLNQFYGSVGSNEQRTAAEAALRQFQEHPEAWTRVDTILEHSKFQHSKVFALQILESTVKYRWGALPDEQRQGIRNYISNLIIKFSTDEALFKSEKLFLKKLNLVLVQILKHDWPHRWPTFIPELVGASRSSETLCENSMHILKYLSEEVFDFSRGELTQAKTKELKNQLNQEFRAIHDLCLFVLMNTQKPELIKATLSALHAYLSWVPLGYIFESNLIQLLLQIFPKPPFRNITLQCLTEVGSLQMGPEFNGHFEMFYKMFMTQLMQILAPGTSIRDAYEQSSDEEQAFVQNLALFLTGFFRAHINLLESTPESQQALLAGLEYLVNISFVDDVEVFKTCLDYWNYFVPDIYTTSLSDGSQQFSFGGGQRQSARTELYKGVLSKLRNLMICRMAKPEEVIIVEDENGQIVREQMKDNDVLTQYRTMRETLIYLSHLDHDDTEQQMVAKLRQQQPGVWTWQGLNTLCWAIGSISGSMQDEQENRFLVTVIRDLLTLCEVTRGKDHKAVIASNIMYVVGQYPKFLRQHWKFLKTVVNKLFEFMHETHPGVQDMACDTFLKICNKCKRKFVVSQPQEREPFIMELLNGLSGIINELLPHQIHTFYEAVGLMISAETDHGKRQDYLAKLMEPPNLQWQGIIAQAASNQEYLKQPEIIRQVQNVLQTNVAVCSSLGHPFISQTQLIYTDMLQVYKLYSELISQSIATGGQNVARSSQVKYMRSIKKVALKLVETFVDKCEDFQLLATQYVPAMMDPVLGDYARNVPDARDAEVLSVFAAIINKLGALMEPEIPRIFTDTFECTLQMITRNFGDYPDHRLGFFSLLHAIVNSCFKTLFLMSPAQLKLVIDSIVWAIRHTERNVAETGLQLLLDMLLKFQGSDYATPFHQVYYLQLLQELLAVMTDTFHKPGFKLQARILHHLFSLVSPEATVLKAPLWDASKGSFPSNAAFVHQHVMNLLATSFPNMTPIQITACVTGMMEIKEFGAFKHHLRDFLVQTKTFASQDNAELFAEEAAQQVEAEKKRLAAIPGMLPPSEALQDDMTDT